MAVRLKVAGLDNNKFELKNNFEELLSGMENCGGEIIYVLATYTAMIDLRKFLYSKGFIKKLW